MALFTIQNEFRYEIVRKIFEGGMGIVYEAEQLGARDFVKRIAIKVVRQNYADQKQFIDNFIGEAKLVADLIHTNIVQTYHLGETRGIFFIAMELIRGVNLEQFYQQLLDKPINFGGREMSCKIVKLSSADGEESFAGCNCGQRGKVSRR